MDLAVQDIVSADRVTHSDLANAVRVLAMDAVEQAKSGHPGLPMGAADMATVLFTKFLKYDAADPAWQVGSFLLGGGAALLAHAGKAGARTIVNTSPEPFSNVIVSTAEDVATGGLLALAIANPIAAALIAFGLVLLSIWLVFAARRALAKLIDRINPPRTPAA